MQARFRIDMEIKLLQPVPLDTVTSTCMASAAVQCIWQHLIGRAEVTYLCSRCKRERESKHLALLAPIAYSTL